MSILLYSGKINLFFFIIIYFSNVLILKYDCVRVINRNDNLTEFYDFLLFLSRRNIVFI